jgi:hypothetical protein
MIKNYTNNVNELQNILMKFPEHIKILNESVIKINNLEKFFTTCATTIPDFKKDYDKSSEILQLKLKQDTLEVLQDEASKLNKTLVSKTYIKSLKDDISELELLTSEKLKDDVIHIEKKLRSEYSKDLKITTLHLDNKNAEYVIIIENKDHIISMLEQLITELKYEIQNLKKINII